MGDVMWAGVPLSSFCGPCQDRIVKAQDMKPETYFVVCPDDAEKIRIAERNAAAAKAKPVSWARRRALDAVLAWVREREKRGTPTGPEREYVNGVDGTTTISGAGKVYASEAVDRMEQLLVDTEVPQLVDALTWALETMARGAAGSPETFVRANALLSRVAKAAP